MSYQKCPVCEGLGQFYDFNMPMFSSIKCPTCQGTRIINTQTGKPPKNEQKTDKSQTTEPTFL